MKIIAHDKLKKLYLIQCDCGRTFQHREDRWNIAACPNCQKVINLPMDNLRESN